MDECTCVNVKLASGVVVSMLRNPQCPEHGVPAPPPSKAKPATHDDYLGDGVYASFDGYMIWLDLRGQDSTTRIGLEPSVLDRLIAYREARIAEAMSAPTA